MAKDFFLLANSDSTVVAELERRAKVKSDREKKLADKDETEEDDHTADIEKWKHLHMQIAESSVFLSID